MAQQDTEARVVTRRQPRSLTQDPLFLFYCFPLELPWVSGDTGASQIAGTQWLAQGKLPGRPDGTGRLCSTKATAREEAEGSLVTPCG